MTKIMLTCRECRAEFAWIGSRFIRLCPSCRAAQVKRNVAELLEMRARAKRWKPRDES